MIKIFQKNQTNSPDRLGAYPERMQVRALPERRFLKTSRMLAVATIINIVVLFMLGTIYIYLTDHADVSISGRQTAHLYSIDYEKKKLIPSEYYTNDIANRYLIHEANLRDYINQRHTILWDDNAMVTRWNERSWLSRASSNNVWSVLKEALNYELGSSRALEFVRDVHIYDLNNVYGNLWEGVIETFDMPIPDAFNPLCQYSDNSKECIQCKILYAKNRHRYKVYIRTTLDGPKTITNPYGFMVDGYYLLHMPTTPDDPVWELPRVLRPDL